MKIKKLIKKTKEKNDKVARVVEKIKKIEIKIQRDKKWQIDGKLVLKEGVGNRNYPVTS